MDQDESVADQFTTILNQDAPPEAEDILADLETRVENSLVQKQKLLGAFAASYGTDLDNAREIIRRNEEIKKQKLSLLRQEEAEHHQEIRARMAAFDKRKAKLNQEVKLAATAILQGTTLEGNLKRKLRAETQSLKTQIEKLKRLKDGMSKVELGVGPASFCLC
jgi:ATP-dependent exoDNAse (exonuclease V) beta subunit